MAEFPTLKGSWPWPWIGSYYIPSCITRRPLPTYQMLLKLKFLWTYRRTFETQVIWSTQRSRPKKDEAGSLVGFCALTLLVGWQECAIYTQKLSFKQMLAEEKRRENQQVLMENNQLTGTGSQFTLAWFAAMIYYLSMFIIGHLTKKTT